MSNSQDEHIIQYNEWAYKDLLKLPANLIKDYKTTIERLKKKEISGKPLTCKNGKDLTGCYKLYFDDARYRIVYTIKTIKYIDGSVKRQVQVIAVLGIGKRENEEIYNEVARRLGTMIQQEEEDKPY